MARALPPASGRPVFTRLACVAAALWLGGCSVEHFERPGADGDAELYASIFPYYAELCALSQIKKRHGFGAEIRGEVGGHSVFYLNGACRDPGSDYPVLQLCDTSAGVAPDGVGLSMNEHFSNAKWVATPGRAFFFDGGLPAGHGLTRTDYVNAKAQAEQLGIYRAITFHSWVFDDKPADVSPEDYKYEMSIATDYATSFGRGRFCAKVPVTRAQMARMIAFLNAENAPYRDGTEIFEWSVFRDNCIHLAHNALAVAGVWREWPINQPLLFAMLDFPVPKNEFVNLMRRTNDIPSLDLATLFQDQSAARSLAEFGTLPWMPGAVAEAHPPQQPNEVYETDLKLVFYDDPILGRYQRRFDELFGNPRYFDLQHNLQYFSGLYRRLAAERQPIEAWLGGNQFGSQADRQHLADFYHRFYAAVDTERHTVDAGLARLSVAAQPAPRLSLRALGEAK